MHPDAYRAFTAELTDRLAADPRAIGLAAVGSMADRDYAPDEWSDHDFFVITQPGDQEELRADLSWLPRSETIALAFRETEHGLKVIYDDGHLLEFAVFDLDEIALAGVNRYRALLDRGGVEERMAHVAAHPRPPHDDVVLFGMLLSAALVAWGRAARGETLSGSFFVLLGVTHLTRLLARHLPADAAPILDGLDPLRRFERVHPELGSELGAIVRLDPAEGGPALLDVLARELRGRLPSLPWAAADAVRARIARTA